MNLNTNRRNLIKTKITTKKEKETLFGLTLHIVKMLQQKSEKFF